MTVSHLQSGRPCKITEQAVVTDFLHCQSLQTSKLPQTLPSEKSESFYNCKEWTNIKPYGLRMGCHSSTYIYLSRQTRKYLWLYMVWVTPTGGFSYVNSFGNWFTLFLGSFFTASLSFLLSYSWQAATLKVFCKISWWRWKLTTPSVIAVCPDPEVVLFF